MSTQRRAVRWQRNPERAGAENSPSIDGGSSGLDAQFRPASDGRTASHSGFSSIWTSSGRDLATNSLSLSSSCTWVHGNSLGWLPFYKVERHDRFFSRLADFAGWNAIPNSFSASFSGFLPSYLALPSKPLQVQLDLCIRPCRRPDGLCRGTERQHGQGNLYFEHAA
jgi:hypothetical protein